MTYKEKSEYNVRIVDVDRTKFPNRESSFYNKVIRVEGVCDIAVGNRIDGAGLYIIDGNKIYILEGGWYEKQLQLAIIDRKNFSTARNDLIEFMYNGISEVSHLMSEMLPDGYPDTVDIKIMRKI